ncbi:1-acyl-sn-glycerol-3-phosphate acyltransferase [Candidatus Bathyarchaeota archaeon]|jgi:1-acyl-sn-glycerol-3-phosphate acyltransferase|nr:MAG: 1-acyl-sn-glycerol-3-phosphate acyltransferase [Candidatus Bathyarchaeota archaeon]
MAVVLKYIKPVVDFVITSLFWIYYIFGYLLFFFPPYLASFIFSSNREATFQRLNHFFFRGFFFLTRTIIPQQKLHIQEEVLSVRSSVIVCNHLSYLDPLLLISLFEKQKTIVKSVFFKIPVFGWLMKTSGYVPSRAGEDFASLMIKNIEGMRDYLSSGGNLFIFPEGTRRRDGKIGRFREGAFKIARLCGAPIKVLFIRNTDILFGPGKFLFNTCVQNSIEVRLIGSIEPDYENDSFSISGLMEQVRSLFESQNSNLQTQ